MKKFTIMLSILTVFGFVTISCISTGGVFNQDLGAYNEYYTEEQTCILEIVSVLKVDVFNGKPVNWVNSVAYGDLPPMDGNWKAFIRIPSGKHELYASYYYAPEGYRGSVEANDIKITYNFIAGRTYRLDAVLLTTGGEMINSPINPMTGIANNVTSIRLAITEINSSPKVKKASGIANDRRLDGTWQFAKDPRFKLVFFGDTWRLILNDKIASDDNGKPLSGVFYLLQDEIHCLIIYDEGLPIQNYKLAGDTFNIESIKYFTWMVGQWKKIDSGRESSESNPLVGTWKAISDNGSVTIFQFYPTGTARRYIYNEPGYINSHYAYDYKYDNSTNTGILEAQNSSITVNYVNNTDELKIQDVTYKRE